MTWHGDWRGCGPRHGDEGTQGPPPERRTGQGHRLRVGLSLSSSTGRGLCGGHRGPEESRLSPSAEVRRKLCPHGRLSSCSPAPDRRQEAGPGAQLETLQPTR